MWSSYPIDHLVISEGVTSIAGEAFYSNHALRGTLTLPSTLRSIGEFAFYGCDGLTALKLPASLEHIKAHAFQNCDGLRGGVTVPDSVYSVGRGAFPAAPP